MKNLDSFLKIRLSSADLVALQRDAGIAGMTVSEYIRWLIERARKSSPRSAGKISSQNAEQQSA